MAFSTVATAVGLQFGAVQTSVAVRTAINSLSPDSRLQKWSQRMAEISARVADNHDYIPVEALGRFLDLTRQYLELKIIFEKDVDQGVRAWFGERKARGNDFRDAARLAWREGLSLTTLANNMKQKCQIEHKDPPKNSRGQCIICIPEEISMPARTYRQNENNPQDLFTWTTFLRGPGQSAQGVLHQSDPPTYSESDVGDDPSIDALDALPREELRSMLDEYLAFRNAFQPNGTEYNPWVSLADLRLSSRVQS